MKDCKFRVAVGGVCHKKGQVLLLHRHNESLNYPCIWELPSGGVQAGETPIEALTREIYEETKLLVKVQQCIDYFIYYYKDKKPCLQVNHLCTLKSKSFDIVKLSSEHDDFQWVEWHALKQYKITPEVMQILNKAYSMLY